MGRNGKRFEKAKELVGADKAYFIEEALDLLEKMPKAKFDESVDIALQLGVDPKNSDQMVRGAIALPHGLGKKVRVLVFAKGEKESEASKAGADHVGLNDLIEKIQGGWLEFDVVIATPDVMKDVTKLGKTLGTKGLMPNPKLGTVTFDIEKAVKDAKKGTSKYRIDKAGIVHCTLGKCSLGKEKLREHYTVLMEQIVRAKPASAKGVYLQKAFLSTTMGPSIALSKAELQKFM